MKQKLRKPQLAQTEVRAHSNLIIGIVVIHFARLPIVMGRVGAPPAQPVCAEGSDNRDRGSRTQNKLVNLLVDQAGLGAHHRKVGGPWRERCNSDGARRRCCTAPTRTYVRDTACITAPRIDLSPHSSPLDPLCLLAKSGEEFFRQTFGAKPQLDRVPGQLFLKPTCGWQRSAVVPGAVAVDIEVNHLLNRYSSSRSVSPARPA